MLNKFFKIVICFFLIIFINVNALSTDLSKDNIDFSKKGSLLINYRYEDLKVNDILVKVYKVASFNKEMQYELVDSFKDYPVKVNGLKDNQEWNTLKQTLLAYIEANSILESYQGSVIDNKFSLSNLDLGLYLVVTEKIENSDYSLCFEPFLISVPNLDEFGYWDYDLDVFPKVSEYIKNYKDVSYSVFKKWNDNGKNRPKSITIEIYKNNELYETKVLSSTNNWSYSWNSILDGSIWNVFERDVPNGYNVSISFENNNFVITNTLDNVDNPQTSDNINLFLYLFWFSLIGLIIVIIYLYKKKKS